MTVVAGRVADGVARCDERGAVLRQPQHPAAEDPYDRGTEYCGNREHHEYQLSLAVEDIDHSTMRAKSPQSNGIVERFQRTMLNEFYQVAFRKKIYRGVEGQQEDADTWVRHDNEQRPHSGRYWFGKTPMKTFLDSLPMAREKMHGYEPASVMA